MLGHLNVNADAAVVAAHAVAAASLGASKIDTFWVLFVQGRLVANIEHNIEHNMYFRTP